MVSYFGARGQFWRLTSIDEVTDALQNVMLQHGDIRTFVRHYQVDVDVDVQGIVRRTESQTHLVRFACSLRASIDPDRPFWLSTEESLSLNELPEIRKWQYKVNESRRNWQHLQKKSDIARQAYQRFCENVKDRGVCGAKEQLQETMEMSEDQTLEAKQILNKVQRQLRNEKQRQRNKRIRENLKRYEKEQPVIDLEQQLKGKTPQTRALSALESTGCLTAEWKAVIDVMITMPGATIEAETQRRIKAISAVTAFCGVAEGRPVPRRTNTSRRPTGDITDSPRPTKRPRQPIEDTEEDTDILLERAIESVRVKSKRERPTICFLCVGNSKLPLTDRIYDYATPGSLTRHFQRRHTKLQWPAGGTDCHVCSKEPLQQKSDLLNHAISAHGTVIGGRSRNHLAMEVNQPFFPSN